MNARYNILYLGDHIVCTEHPARISEFWFVVLCYDESIRNDNSTHVFGVVYMFFLELRVKFKFCSKYPNLNQQNIKLDSTTKRTESHRKYCNIFDNFYCFKNKNLTFFAAVSVVSDYKCDTKTVDKGKQVYLTYCIPFIDLCFYTDCVKMCRFKYCTFWYQFQRAIKFILHK